MYSGSKFVMCFDGVRSPCFTDSNYDVETLVPDNYKVNREKDGSMSIILKLIILCGIWYCSSAINSITLKRCLTSFPYPLSLTVVQFLGCASLTYPLLKYLNVGGSLVISKGLFITGILPLSFGKVAAVFFATVSIGNIPVSFSNTIKASLPIFSVLFSRVLLKQKHSCLIYLSLLVIISGVVISSFTEVLFDLSGFVSALLSTMSTALLSVYAKKSMLDNNLHYLVMLYYVSLSSLVLTFPLWVLQDVPYLLQQGNVTGATMDLLPSFCLIAVSNFSQNVAAFGFLSLVTPVSYSVANCLKRVFTIVVSLIILKNPVSNLNVLGMLASIAGVAMYNKVKYDETSAQRTTLPTTVKQSTPSKTSILHNGAIGEPLKTINSLIITDYNSRDKHVLKTSDKLFHA